MTDYQAAYMDAVERCWVRDGDLGLSTRKVDAEVKLITGRKVAWSNVVAPKWGGKEGLLDAVFERAVGEVWAWMATAVVCADTTSSLAAVEWLYMELCSRPFLARLVATGIGPEARGSDDLVQVRARLVNVISSPCGVEAFHGLVAGEVAGRWRPTDDERRDALRAVLVMAETGAP